MYFRESENTAIEMSLNQGCLVHPFFDSSIFRTSFDLSLLRGLPKGQMGHIAPQFFQLYSMYTRATTWKDFNRSKRGVSCNINKHNANPPGTAGQG